MRPALGGRNTVVTLAVVQLPAVQQLLLHDHDLVLAVVAPVAVLTLPAVVLPAPLSAATDALQLNLYLMLRVAPVAPPAAAPARPLPSGSTARPASTFPTTLATAALPAVPPALAIPRLPASKPPARQPVQLVLAGLATWGAEPPVPPFYMLPVALVTSTVAFVTVAVRFVSIRPVAAVAFVPVVPVLLLPRRLPPAPVSGGVAMATLPRLVLPRLAVAEGGEVGTGVGGEPATYPRLHEVWMWRGWESAEDGGRAQLKGPAAVWWELGVSFISVTVRFDWVWFEVERGEAS